MSSSIEILATWARTRARVLLFATLAGAMTAVASLVGGGWDPEVLAARFGWVLALLLVQRLAHDLGDRLHDRRHHPDRILAHAEPTPFVRIVGAAGLALAAALLLTPEPTARSLLFLATVVPLLALELRLAPADAAARLRRFHVLALKYPAILAVLLGPRSWAQPGLCALLFLLVYLVATCHEISHDPSHTHRRRLLAVEFGALLLTLPLVVHLSLGALR